MSDMHFNAIDLNLLRVFDMLLEERSVTRAGARLGLTQSAVSHALGRLRHGLGDELFVRGPGGMQPTQRALEIGPGLHAALLQLQAALAPAAFDPAVTERQFTLVAGAYACAVFMPQVVARFRSEAPRAQLRIAGFGGDLAESLEAGRADAVIGGFEGVAGRFGYERLLTESMVWIVRTGHPLAEAPVTLDRLAGVPHAVVSNPQASLGRSEGPGRGLRRRASWEDLGAFETELARQGLQRQIGVIVPDTFSALAIVGRSDMAALVPRRLAEMSAHGGKLRLLEPPYASPPVDIGALYLLDRAGEPALAWLLGLLAQAVSGM